MSYASRLVTGYHTISSFESRFVTHMLPRVSYKKISTEIIVTLMKNSLNHCKFMVLIKYTAYSHVYEKYIQQKMSSNEYIKYKYTFYENNDIVKTAGNFTNTDV